MKKRNMTAGIAFVLVLAMARGGCGRTEQAAYNAKQNYEAGRGSAAYDAVKAAGAKETAGTGKTNANYGKTFGKPQLSEAGAKYYEELKKK